MRNVTEKKVGKIEAHILPSITFFSENRAFYETVWKNMVVPDRPNMVVPDRPKVRM
jgi:beta-galactosidase GanA